MCLPKNIWDLEFQNLKTFSEALLAKTGAEVDGGHELFGSSGAPS